MVVLLAVALVGTGCVLTSSVPTERQYALAQRIDGTLAVLATADPLYDRFDQQVLSDPTLQRLLMLFEHTTESFLATNGTIPAPQTVANRLVIVLDSDTTGVLRDVRLATPGGQARMELALGLGQDGRIDLEGARHRMAAAMGPLLLELGGRQSPDGFSMAALASPDEPVSPEEALWAGYALALEADYARPFLGMESLEEALLGQRPPPTDALARQRAIVARAEAAEPLVGEGSARSEAGRTPSMVAAFLVALHQRAGHYYPQRHMLWMVSYEPDEIPYGKVLLTMMRCLQRCMPPQGASVEDLIATYADTYPAERRAINDLADAMLGPTDGGGGR
jgi:hypothetical protein